MTQKPGRLYLHVFDWPGDGTLTLPISNPVKKARVLGHASTAVKVEKGTGGVKLILPKLTPDAHATVLALDIAGPAAVIQ